jgi:hypothetical protein
VEVELYSIMADHSVQCFEVPPHTSARQLISGEVSELIQQTEELHVIGQGVCPSMCGGGDWGFQASPVVNMVGLHAQKLAT